MVARVSTVAFQGIEAVPVDVQVMIVNCVDTGLVCGLREAKWWNACCQGSWINECHEWGLRSGWVF